MGKKFVPLTDRFLFNVVMTAPENRDGFIDFLKTMSGISEEVIRKDLVVSVEQILGKEEENPYMGDIVAYFDHYCVVIENRPEYDYDLFSESVTKAMAISSRLSEDFSVKEIIQIIIIHKDKTHLFKNIRNELHLKRDNDDKKEANDGVTIKIYNSEAIQKKLK